MAAWEVIANITGPVGPQGPQGPPGTTPGPASETAAGIVELATTTEMEAAVPSALLVPSVARVQEYVTAHGGGAPSASESQAGLVELATAAEMSTGTDASRVAPVARVAEYVATAIAGKADAVHAATHAELGSDPLAPGDIGAVAATLLGTADGVATLDSTGLIPVTQVPGIVNQTENTIVKRDAAGRVRGFDAATDMDLVNLRTVNTLIAAGGGGAAGSAAVSKLATTMDLTTDVMTDIPGLTQSFLAGDMVLVAATIDWVAESANDMQFQIEASGAGTTMKGWIDCLSASATGQQSARQRYRITQGGSQATKRTGTFGGTGLAASQQTPITLECVVSFAVDGTIKLQAALNANPAIAGTISASIFDGSYMTCGLAAAAA